MYGKIRACGVFLIKLYYKATACGSPDKEVEEIGEKVVVEESRKQLPVTVDEFLENWNEVDELITDTEKDDRFIIDELKEFKFDNLEEDEEGFQFKIDDNTSIQGIAYDDGYIKEVYINTEWEDFEYGRRVEVMAWSFMLGAIDPNTSIEERVDIIDVLGVNDDMAFMEAAHEYVTDDYKITLAFYDQMDIVRFSVTDN